MSINYGYQPISINGLVLHLDAANSKSYLSGSTAWNDLSGNRNNGTLISGSAYNSADYGSIIFNGSNSYASSNINSIVTSQASVSFWIYTSSTEAQFINYVFSLGSGSSSVFGVWVGGTYFDSVIAPKSIGIYFQHNGSTASSVANTFTTTDYNRWHNICAVYNSGSGVTLYKNTTQLAMYSNALTGSVPVQDSYNVARRSDGFWYWNGRVSNVQVYNRALSASEVQQNYLALKSRYNL